ncbi:hypothetical protein F0562_014296 [Nyssa sinensis]|uniref:F-box domain-containing protein n=1 Tax=Nyssa sinensis TaxID=561372 RepID=A0A5J4ZN80_9ASTE|nr:hypothetical protein F0562_014296 [Nyssa sinensis]
MPDEVLHLILDKLPLDDAIRTGVLSHRWKSLWKYITNIKFGPSWERSTGKEIGPSLNQFIRNYLGEKIQRFSVELAYQPNMSNEVDSWIQFATSKNVEKLNLDFDSISLHNLKQVYLHQMELPDDAIYRLTSNTPVLEVLSLDDCNRSRDFHITIAPNPHFDKLMIYEEFPVEPSTIMVVLAPNTKEFILRGYMTRKKYIIRNMFRCVRAGLCFNHMLALCTEEEEEEEEEGEEGDEEEGNFLVNDRITQKTEDVLLEILCSFQEATFLQICNWCIQMLSSRERRNIGSISLNCQCLDLNTNFQKWELPGIVFMLKACHKLEHLLIIMPPYHEEIELPEDYLMRYDFQASGYLINAIQAFMDPLQNLKAVEIRNTGGDYQTWKPESFEMHKFFQGAELGIELLILLRGITVNLQHMTFSTNEQQHVLPILL